MSTLPPRAREIFGAGDLNVVLARHRTEDRMVPLLTITDTGGQAWIVELSNEDLRALHKTLSMMYSADRDTVHRWWQALADGSDGRPRAAPVPAPSDGVNGAHSSEAGTGHGV